MTTGTPDSPDPSVIGVGELSRMVRDTLVRFEGLAQRLETQFVRQDNFLLYKTLVDQALKALQDDVAKAANAVTVAEKIKALEDGAKNLASKDDLKVLAERVTDLEGDRRWLIRLIMSFVILGVLGAVFYVAKAGGGG